jgi:hypothetical protein
LEKTEFSTIRNRYEKLTPKALNTQFEERLSKNDAVQRYSVKSSALKTTQAFPSGKTLLNGIEPALQLSTGAVV